MSALEHVLVEFRRRLGSIPADSLLNEFQTKHQQYGDRLLESLQQALIDWNATPLDESVMNSLCIAFEDEFRKGNNPRLDQWLMRAPRASHANLIGSLLETEAYQRSKRGETVDWSAYKRQFPEFHSAIHEVFLQVEKEGKQPEPIQLDNHPEDVSTQAIAKPNWLGKILNQRYRLDRVLGTGAFGTVYLAHDTELNRQVAVKLQIRGNKTSIAANEDYLEEAKFAASLRHPHILTVYTVDRNEEQEVFIVAEFIDGGTLRERIDRGDLDYRQMAKIIRGVAEALYHAHQRGLIHRDIKPANILIENDSLKAYVADFGLATREYEYLQKGDGAGSPAYKSPEQVRREGHRLDGRSDLFSLGIVFYEMLTGERPFRGSSVLDTEKQIRYHQPTAPRSLKGGVPEELERICFKLLQKEASSRYSNGLEVANEIRDWLYPKPIALLSAHHENSKITPRGLRTFTDEDAGFFLELLPGSRDRQGLPESVAFWKKRIEQNDPDKTFSVGIINGPSGSGKSSLVKAGIIPQLDKSIIAIHVDATAEDTESRLLHGLQKKVESIKDSKDLTQAMMQIRRAETIKVVLFIDQFEQWLNSHRSTRRTELVDALRQCDGRTLQSVLMVRDDFGSAIKFLTDDLDSTIDRDRNYAWIDLFDVKHAKDVLVRFGQAYGKLPKDSEHMTFEQSEFVEQVISGLAQDEGVIPVQLALFADMVKNKSWESATLKGVGGTTGVVVNFLEEAFSSRNPQNLVYQNGARSVLKALMPVSGSDIKGHHRPEHELLDASGYGNKPNEFRRLMRILDSDLRLIRPSQEPDDLEKDASKSYQLTHDYLVPSLREWLTRKQRETDKGRAELKLSERAGVWSSNRENRQLPSLLEWINILRWTQPAKWTKSEALMMSKASKLYRNRFATYAAIVAVIFATAYWLKNDFDNKQRNAQARNFVDSLKGSDIENVQKELEKIKRFRPWIDDLLQKELEKDNLGSDERLKLNMALLGQSEKALVELKERLPTVDPKRIRVLIRVLEPYSAGPKAEYWEIAKQRDPRNLLQVASFLASYDSKNDQWTQIANHIADRLVKENPLQVGTWIETLKPVKAFLIPELIRIYSAKAGSRSPTEIELATEILVNYASDFKTVHELAMQGDPQQFQKFFPKYAQFDNDLLKVLKDELSTPITRPVYSATDEQAHVQRQIERKANAAVTLLRLDDRQSVLDFLTIGNDPEALSQFIFRIRGRIVDPVCLKTCLDKLEGMAEPIDLNLRQQHFYRIYAMVLGLGEFSLEQFSIEQRQELLQKLESMYRDHPSKAVHGAVGWLLRRWRQETILRKIDETLLDCDATGKREWYVVKLTPLADSIAAESPTTADSRREIDLQAPTYITMITFRSPSKNDTATEGVAEHNSDSDFAVSDREITWRQFSPFDQDSHRKAREKEFKRICSLDEPVIGVNWFEVALYCRTVTGSARNEAYEQAYEEKDTKNAESHGQGWLDFTKKEDWEWGCDSCKPGFRMLTADEWKFAALSGMTTPYCFGSSEELLAEYAWYQENARRSPQPTGLLRPSIGGLFDIHGNVWEWINDWHMVGSVRALRGGAWGVDSLDCQVDNKEHGAPSVYRKNRGFRIGQTIPKPIQ